MTALILAAALGLAVGYLVGRWRPAKQASEWAWWGLGVGRPSWTRRDPRWWLAQGVFAVEIGMLLAAHPRKTVHAWRHRHDPPLRAEPLRMDPNWAANRHASNPEETP